MKNELVVKKTVELKADISKVWEALTNPELTKKYMFGCEVISDWEVGSSIIWKGLSEGKERVFVKGNIINVILGKRLEYSTFDPNSDLEDVPSNYTVVTYDLSPKDKNTILSVAQGDFTNVVEGEKRYQDTIKGWDFALSELKKVVES
ncbi:MAG: SRPBCC domain-containing protein [Promethearchaeota archaeon]